MWLNKNVAIINAMLKDFRYYEFEIYIFVNKIKFRIGAFNQNMYFLYM